jgi:hypothetical protein
LVDVPQRRQFDYCAGAAARDVGAASVVMRDPPYAVGCGWMSRAALWLGCEQWYVKMEVPEGGFGGPLCVARQLVVAPKLLQC